jgi:hypothetical protein
MPARQQFGGAFRIRDKKILKLSDCCSHFGIWYARCRVIGTDAQTPDALDGMAIYPHRP